MLHRNRLVRSDLKGKKIVRRVHGALFSVSVTERPHPPRATCTVGKHVSTRAVDRNRIKRLCREALRPLIPALPPGAYVFSAKREARNASLADICADTEVLAKRLRGI